MKSSNQTVSATALGDAGALGLPSGAGAAAGGRAEEIALGGARAFRRGSTACRPRVPSGSS